jgi:hypothetical protein
MGPCFWYRTSFIEGASSDDVFRPCLRAARLGCQVRLNHPPEPGFTMLVSQKDMFADDMDLCDLVEEICEQLSIVS